MVATQKSYCTITPNDTTGSVAVLKNGDFGERLREGEAHAETRRVEHQDSCGYGRRHKVAGFELSAGNVADAQAGRLLLESLGPLEQTVQLVFCKIQSTQ